MGSGGFWRELKRRHVYRVAAVYVVVGWLLIQVATQVFPVFHLPDWTEQAVVLVILVGFPIALVLAWAFDATPAGVVRADAAPEGGAGNPTLRRRSRRTGAAVASIGIVLAAVAGVAWWHPRVSRVSSPPASSVLAAAASSPDGAKRNPGMATPDSSAGATSSGLRNPSSIAAQPIPAKSIAVLPFVDMSGDQQVARMERSAIREWPPRIPSPARLHPGYVVTWPRNPFRPSPSRCCRSST